MKVDLEILQKVQTLKKPAIIGISGFGGSGKSTFAKTLAVAINAPIVGVDSFYTPTAQSTYHLWEIMDYERLLQEVIKPYLSGTKVINYGEFDWEHTGIQKTTMIKASDFLIIEGVGLFRPEIVACLSYKIWMGCAIEVAIERGKKRDLEVYGVNQDENWEGIWRTNDLECFECFAPVDIADKVLNTDV